MMNPFREQIQKEYLVSLRREFHRHPELALQETAQQRRSSGNWTVLAFPIRVLARQVCWGSCHGEKAGSGVVALRADIDALPIQENNDVEYRSQTEGVMHAAAHDAIRRACWAPPESWRKTGAALAARSASCSNRRRRPETAPWILLTRRTGRCGAGIWTAQCP